MRKLFSLFTILALVILMLLCNHTSAYCAIDSFLMPQSPFAKASMLLRKATAATMKKAMKAVGIRSAEAEKLRSENAEKPPVVSMQENMAFEVAV